MVARTMSKPIAVLGADFHFNINTLSLANAAAKQLIAKANELGVQAVFAGDTHDTKAYLRAECEETMLNTFAEARIDPLVLIGNHCRRNERSPEHALHFLKGVAHIIYKPCTWSYGALTATLIPYQHDPEDFRKAINQSNPLVICHQGLIGADMGHYVQDKSAITKEDVADYRVVSGHYHRRQDIKCGRPRKGALGLFSYIGNPYTLSFGEAKDPPKGFQILMDDGTLEFVPTNLRQHIKAEETVADFLDGAGQSFLQYVREQDLLRLVLRGTSAQLASLSKKDISKIIGREDFKYDPIRTDVGTEAKVTPKMSHTEAMDAMIDGSQDEPGRKTELKKLYRELLD